MAQTLAGPGTTKHSTDTVERLGQVGLSARGVVYCLVGLIAVAVAMGDPAAQADQRGALEELAERPLGRVVLALLVVGFVCYAGWRLARAVRGEGGKEPNAGQRALDVAKAALYLALAYSAAKLALGDGAESGSGGGGSGGGGEAQARGFSGRLMAERSWGRWAVGLAGAGVIAYGLWQVWRGISEKFRKRLEESYGKAHSLTIGLGVVGHVARGAVFVVIGWLIIRAATDFDPAQPVGIDAALREVLQAPYGPLLAVAIALGLGAYGLYSFGEARYRQIT